MNQKEISPLFLMIGITASFVMLKVIQLLFFTLEIMFISDIGVGTGTSRAQKLLMVLTPLSGNIQIDMEAWIPSG